MSNQTANNNWFSTNVLEIKNLRQTVVIHFFTFCCQIKIRNLLPRPAFSSNPFLDNLHAENPNLQKLPKLTISLSSVWLQLLCLNKQSANPVYFALAVFFPQPHLNWFLEKKKRSPFSFNWAVYFFCKSCILWKGITLGTNPAGWEWFDTLKDFRRTLDQKKRKEKISKGQDLVSFFFEKGHLNGISLFSAQRFAPFATRTRWALKPKQSVIDVFC